jgi:hypothetical protein
VAKPELGTKRVCPETGRKFYDLNKDPIVSPYTGKEYPISYFEETAQNAVIENGALAQLGERLHGMQEVSGSIPLGSTTSESSWRANPDSRSGWSRARRNPPPEPLPIISACLIASCIRPIPKT